jgi:hypothetical protein
MNEHISDETIKVSIEALVRYLYRGRDKHVYATFQEGLSAHVTWLYAAITTIDPGFRARQLSCVADFACEA